MNTGMGMLRGTPGAPMGEDYGASLGRGMGFGSDSDVNATNGRLSATDNPDMKQHKPAIEPMQMNNTMAMNMGGAAPRQMIDIAPNANDVPNFPQDAYMESEMMNMESDRMLHIPENYGLPPGWSPYMQGMMTFLRVLPPDKYDEVIARMRQANRPNDPYASLLRG